VDKLIGVPDEKLTEAVIKAAKAKMIPCSLLNKAGGFIRQLKRFSDGVYQAKLQLCGDKTNSSLPNYEVQVFASYLHGKPEHLATSQTDRAGTFTISYSTPRVLKESLQ